MFFKKALFFVLVSFIQGKNTSHPSPVCQQKQRKIIIENKDDQIKHERREERVESRYFELIGEKNHEKCNAKKPHSHQSVGVS